MALIGHEISADGSHGGGAFGHFEPRDGLSGGLVSESVLWPRHVLMELRRIFSTCLRQ